MCSGLAHESLVCICISQKENNGASRRQYTKEIKRKRRPQPAPAGACLRFLPVYLIWPAITQRLQDTAPDASNSYPGPAFFAVDLAVPCPAWHRSSCYQLSQNVVNIFQALRRVRDESGVLDVEGATGESLLLIVTHLRSDQRRTSVSSRNETCRQLLERRKMTEWCVRIHLRT